MTNQTKNQQQIEPNRRDALMVIGGACAAASLSLGGCTFSEVYGSLSAQTLNLSLTDEMMAPLREVGGLAPVDADAWKVLLIRRSESEIIALNRVCTHLDCDMLPGIGVWDTESENLTCICHNSKFGPDGAVVQKPADGMDIAPLVAHEVRFDPASDEFLLILGGSESEPVGETP